MTFQGNQADSPTTASSRHHHPLFVFFVPKKTIIFGASYISVVIFLGEILALVMGMKAQRRGCVKLVRFPQPTSSWDKLPV